MDWHSASWRQQLRRRLRTWYADHRRSLPWRESTDPYRIWVSEIMLQQTQVQTVRAYFLRFMQRFPTVQDLAVADEQEVLRLWEGLGYYRRARQMHLAARVIVDQHEGVFPTDFDAVLALPGIGRYTAGAILSISQDQRLPILEANTIRLNARLTALPDDPRSKAGQDLLWEFAEAILPTKRVGEFNQALMELGSLVCTPKTPRCLVCPLKDLCPTCQQGLQGRIPLAPQKTVYHDVHEVAVVVQRNSKFLLRRCQPNERWAGLWDFIRFPVESDAVSDIELQKQIFALTNLDAGSFQALTTIRHGVTKYRITLRCVLAAGISGRINRSAELQWVTRTQLAQIPLSVTGRKISKLL
ncbi:MAG: A/G-specific adenine glycosylase [Planctomycetales bacterium]|nr:A/G-specific adenine glycosylase [Planctomycetales bacterium]